MRFLSPIRRFRSASGGARPGFLLLGALLGASYFALSPAIGGAYSSSDRLLVKFSPGASAQARFRALMSADGREASRIQGIDVHVISVPSSSAATALARLEASPAVEFAELDTERQPQEILPSDPSFPKQYAIGGGAWGWYKTNTTQAWDI